MSAHALRPEAARFPPTLTFTGELILLSSSVKFIFQSTRPNSLAPICEVMFTFYHL